MWSNVVGIDVIVGIQGQSRRQERLLESLDKGCVIERRGNGEAVKRVGALSLSLWIRTHVGSSYERSSAWSPGGIANSA